MNFDDTPEQAAFRDEIRSWLRDNARVRSEKTSPRSQEQLFNDAKAWYKKVYDAGYACLDWPVEYGGAGLDPIRKVIWSQEMQAYDEPDGYFVIGIGNCGPALMHFAGEEQKLELLPRMASAENVWCQLFSEPSAGSDLAGLRTRAVLQDDEWIVNGQKIWTSGAQYSDYGVILCRTDPEASKYRGLTMFFIDMRQPGIEVHPIRQMDGGAHFNEVFLSNAVIPDTQRLGGVNEGWNAALLILMNERLAVADMQPNSFPEFLDFVQTPRLGDEPAHRDKAVRAHIADWYCKHAGIQASIYRMLTTVAQGGIPGAEASMTKLVGAIMNQEISAYALQLMGETGAIMDEELADYHGHFQRSFLFAPGIRVAGGTDEIMRNIIAEQVLGLPQEPRVDKGKPFKEIPSGNQG